MLTPAKLAEELDNLFDSVDWLRRHSELRPGSALDDALQDLQHRLLRAASLARQIPEPGAPACCS